MLRKIIIFPQIIGTAFLSWICQYVAIQSLGLISKYLLNGGAE